VPTLHRDPEYIFLLVGLIGTTITPYMQLYQQSSIVERGSARRHYGPERLDAYLGVGFSNLMSIFMIMATAATLHRAGHLHIETAADVVDWFTQYETYMSRFRRRMDMVVVLDARRRGPPARHRVRAGRVLGFPGVNLDFRRAGTFFGLFTS
jgi:hypothetical protein